MRLIRLEIEGFGPFKDKQEIEFAQFQKEGLFLIEGDTGAGKSSILDAITFALYNFTARWNDSSANAVHKSVRSHYSGPTDMSSVVLEFEVPAESGFKTYRITRTLGLDKEGNEDPVKQKVTLDEILQDGETKTIGARKTEVDVQIRKLLRLEPTEFLQVVLLAQGKFEAFLEADNDERLKLIRKLFNTGRFEKVQLKLKSLADDKKSGIDGVENNLATNTLALAQNLGVEAPSTGTELPWVEENLKSATASAAELEDLYKKADTELTVASDQNTIAESQSELSRLTSELAELKKQEKPVSALAAKIEAGDRAAKIAGSYEALQAAHSGLNEATLALEHLDLDSQIPKEAAEVRTLLASANSMLGTLVAPLAAEASLSDLRKAEEEAAGLFADAKRKLTEIEDEIGELNVERKALRPLAHNLEDNRLAFEVAEAAMQRFKNYQDVKIEIGNLSRETQTLAGVADAAKAAYGEIFTEYKNSQAALLAGDLHLGQECPVCGATEHPNKAKSSGQVSEKQLEQARIAAEKATADLATSNQKLLDAGERFTPLQEEFSSAKASVLEKSLAKAEADHKSSRTAATRIAEIADLADGETSDLVIAKNSAIESRDKLSVAAISAKTEVTSAEKLIAKHLGDFESIEARSDWLNSQIEQLRHLEDLLSAKSRAASTLQSAEVAFNKQLASNKFDSLETFVAAFIESDELEDIRAEVLAHKDELNRVSALLSQNKFKGLPTKKLDALATAEAFSQAQTKRDDAKTYWESSKAKVAQIKSAKKAIQSLVGELGSSRATYELYRGLSEAMNGKGKNTKQMSLEVYFAAAELETILEAANLHLSTMDAGDQFTLMHSDRSLRGAGQSGLGIEVMDDHTSRTRLPVSLSGGEKFQVSLAIALGLAQVVSERAGSIQVDTLFIDEGFGTLSGPVLESAMRTLDGLKQGGRMIGLISHVEKMKDEINAKVIVEKTPRGPSKVTTQI